MRFHNVDKRRIFALNDNQEVRGPILYWMTRDQRADDNWGLLLAQEIALHTESELHVCFCLKGDIPERLSFQIAGLEETSSRLQELNIPFYMMRETEVKAISDLINTRNIGMVITDFFPLKENSKKLDELNQLIDIPFWEVDSHNIIPARKVSKQKETSIEEFREKVSALLDEYLVDYLPLKHHSFNKFDVDNEKLFKEALQGIISSKDKARDLQLKPGTIEAFNTLILFLEKKLSNYGKSSNDPDEAVLSNISSYLHFGQISAQRVALVANKLDTNEEGRRKFLDNLIVRKELCDNFCLYEQGYDKLSGADDWARESLLSHQNDARKFSYTINEFEAGRTHSCLWNSAHRQLMKTGRLHWLLRKFWANKILEWTDSPEKALEIAITLSDTYSLDAPDPMGYAGIMQAVCGLYEEPVADTTVTGRIPVINQSVVEQNLDVKYYCQKWDS